MRQGRLLLAIPLVLALSAFSSCTGAQGGATSRSYHLGFTPLPHGVSTEALEFAYEKIALNADLVAHHFDNGIPWNEALTDSYPYAANIMNDWAYRKGHTPSGHQIYVAITPVNGLRTGLSSYRKNSDNLPLVAPFDAYGAANSFDAADVKTAYLNYCKRVIAYFDPDYLAIGIEVNLLRKNSGATPWDKFLRLNAYVYAQLKTLYPNLPIFVSVAGAPLLLGYETPPSEFGTAPDPATAYRDSQRAALAQAMVDSDYYALSFYPYLTSRYGSLFPLSYPLTMFDELFGLSSKPAAIAETGYPAEDLNLLGLTFVGSQDAQVNYLRSLLDHANERDMKFLVNFVLRDYTALCNVIGCPDEFRVWQSTGIFDAAGASRRSEELFHRYLSLPLRATGS